MNMQNDLYYNIGSELYGKKEDRVLNDMERSILESIVRRFEILDVGRYKEKKTGKVFVTNYTRDNQTREEAPPVREQYAPVSGGVYL